MLKTLIIGLALSASLAGGAIAQSTGESRPIQFETANDKIAKTNMKAFEYQKRAGYYDEGAGLFSGGGFGSGTGLGGSSATSNFYQFVDQSTIQCETGAVCSRGSNTSSGAQTTTGSSVNADTSISGNTVSTKNTQNNEAAN